MYNYCDMNDFKWQRPKQWKGDCRLMLFSKLLGFLNYEDVSPMEILGLGSGLGFYMKEVKLNNINLIAVEGRMLQTEEQFCNNRNIKFCRKDYYRNSEISSKAYFEELLSNLEDGKCSIMASLDRYYLDYLNIEKAHYGYHAVLLISYDHLKKNVVVADVMSDKLETLSLDLLFQAMFADIPYAAPNGSYYIINTNKSNFRSRIEQERIKDAIIGQAKIMTEKGGPIYQMHQLAMFLQKTSKKAETSKHYERYLIHEMRFLFSTFRELDGSKSFYRELYFNFLDKYCGIILNKEKSDSLLLDFKHIITKWISITTNIAQENHHIITKTSELSKILLEISLLEERIFKQLISWLE